MLIRIISILFCLYHFSLKANHAIYLSVVEIEQGTISIKVFSDDLQDAVRNDSDDYAAAEFNDFIEKNKELINDYFNKSFKLSINNRNANLQLVATKRENDAHFLYFTFESDSDWKQLNIKGDFFAELFPDQSNIISIQKEEEKYFARLTKSNPIYSVTFD